MDVFAFFYYYFLIFHWNVVIFFFYISENKDWMSAGKVTKQQVESTVKGMNRLWETYGQFNKYNTIWKNKALAACLPCCNA